MKSGEASTPPSPWRDNRFGIFAVGNVVNNVGDSVYDVTLPLLSYELTGSLTVMATLAAFIPATLLLGPVLGAIADRHGARALVVPGLVVQLVAAAVIVVAMMDQGASVWWLFGFGALLQVGGAAYRVGWMTSVPTMFPETPVRARGTLSSLFVLATIVGPLLVAGLLNFVGYTGLLAINLVTFVAPIIVWYSGIRPPCRPAGAVEPVDMVRDIVVGWRVIRSDRRLWSALLVGLPLEIVFSVGTTSLVIFYLRDGQGLAAESVATVQLFTNLAALTGSLAVSERRRFSVPAVLAVVSVGGGIFLTTMSVVVLWVVIAAYVAFYLLDGAIAATYSMIPVKYLPTDVYGRALGIIRLMLGVPAVVAPVLIATVGAQFGPRLGLVLLGTVSFASALLLAGLRSSWRGQNDPG